MKTLAIIALRAGLLLSLFLAGYAEAAPSVVTVSGRQVIVQKRLPDGSLAAGVPYTFKGIAWNPGTRAPQFGPDPSIGTLNEPYGFFFDGPWRPGLQGHDLMNIWLRQEQVNRYLQDIPLMAQMNVNTVRVYLDLGTSAQVYQQILDQFYNNNIMVILTVVVSKEDIDSGRYMNTVQLCQDHPAILMWSIGNEWNLNSSPFYGYPNMVTAIAAVNQVAAAIKAIDSAHPITSSLGDRFTLSGSGPCGPGDPNNSDIPAIVNRATEIDIWGLNVFRGSSFNTLFADWQNQTGNTKPFYLSEFGTDSFRTDSYTTPFSIPPCNLDNRGIVTTGSIDQQLQATFDQGLWNEISANLSALDPAKNCVGGFVFEFNDELWKVGNFNVSLGDLVDYTGPEGQSYNDYNSQGFHLQNGHPDNFANEEYFGLMTADRQPKAAFDTFRTLYAGTPAVTLMKSVDKSTGTANTLLTYSLNYSNTGNGDAQNVVISDPLPAGTTLVPGSITAGGTFSSGTIQWNIGTVQSAGSGTVSFQVQIL
jgi:uncharacterized repeat protein (TIGR01451 family)